MQERPTRPDDAKVQRILRWRESLSTLPDDHFFELVRIYAGEIRTPFNKQKLIEQLSAIFHKPQNLENIVSYISDFDINILAAISFLGDAPQEELIDFLSGEYPLSEIYSELMNLHERLIVYSYKKPNSEKPVLSINPLLEDALSPLITMRTLLPPAPQVVHKESSPPVLSPNFIAAFLSYIESSPDLCKSDGGLRKKDAERLSELFPMNADCLGRILSALLNLGIVIQGARHTTVDGNRAAVFAELPECKQYAYISAAAAARLGRTSLQKQAQLLLDISATIPPEGFTRQSLLRAAALHEKKSEAQYGAAPMRGRFSRMMAQSRAEQSDEAEASNPIESIIGCALELGFFPSMGKTEGGVQVFGVCTAFRTEMESEAAAPPRNSRRIHGRNAREKDAQKPPQDESKRGLLDITSETNIAVRPGLSLLELLELTPFLDIVRCGTALEFEVTKKSACHAFDKDILPEQIYERISVFCEHEIPQDFKAAIGEWYDSYSAATMYQGCVIKVNEKNGQLIEKNPRLARYVQAKLAPGIYFLNVRSDIEARSFMLSSRLDFISTVKTARQNDEALPFPPLSAGKSIHSEHERQARAETSGTAAAEERQKKAAAVRKAFHEALDSMEMSQQQRTSLSARIDRNIILSKEQLNPNTVRLEILEAGGINYSAKINLIESAISAGDLIELDSPGDGGAFFGRPLAVSRHEADTLVKMQVEPSKEIRLFSISKANLVRRIKTSLF